ncbi:hypothetical protein [Lacisediminimonas profundi]|uniref:hypothetical protein n=1 Tax=Lacisediminimonas profundi TaxID=2603856 RepID=UPI00124B8647|nr:hypothetical protein [Lacisediminimonas profundi]
MMRGLHARRFAALLPLLLCLCAGPLAAAGKDQPAAAAQPAMPAKGLVLRGSLGDQQVQMQLRPKPDEEGGVEGEYFVFGQGRSILLAGEFDQDGFWMEESVNGTNVSGQWEGKREGDLFNGSWRGADDGPPRPFSLRRMNIAPTARPDAGR